MALSWFFILISLRSMGNDGTDKFLCWMENGFELVFDFDFVEEHGK